MIDPNDYYNLTGRIQCNPQVPLRTLYDELIAQYADGFRHYHTITHIADCLKEYKMLAQASEVADFDQEVGVLFPNKPAYWPAIEMALWYHDAKQFEEHHEKKSAEFARHAIRQLRPYDADFEPYVCGLILATKHSISLRRLATRVKGNVRHPWDKTFLQDSLFVRDIDLAIFGKSREEFDLYERQIRAEYSFISRHTFWHNRHLLLQKFLKRRSIYSTPYFQHKYEEQARENLEWSIRSHGYHLRSFLDDYRPALGETV